MTIAGSAIAEQPIASTGAFVLPTPPAGIVRARLTEQVPTRVRVAEQVAVRVRLTPDG